MAAEPYSISNPKNNNKDLAVFFYDAKGAKRQIALVRPGQSYRPEKQLVWVEQRARPAKLEISQSGEVSTDTRPGGPTKVAQRPR